MNIPAPATSSRTARNRPRALVTTIRSRSRPRCTERRPSTSQPAAQAGAAAATAALAVPQQMNEEMRAYGANLIVTPTESTNADGKAGIDKATAKERFAANEEDYLLALRASNIAGGIPGKENEANMLRLAAGSMAFLKGASLVNKYYSLGGQRDQQGNLVLTNRKALSAQLDLARQLAREAAAKARQNVGYVPVAARLAYQLGVASREGNDDDKLQALEAFWEAAFWSELAANSTAAK